MSKMGRKDFSRRDRLRWSWVIRLTCYTLKRFIWRKKDATEKGARIFSIARYPCKVEKILKDSLDSIPSHSVKIQIMCKGPDYGRPERKKPSLHGRKFTPTPKFLGTAKAYFVCHFGPIFQISLIYAHIGCLQSVSWHYPSFLDDISQTWPLCSARQCRHLPCITALLSSEVASVFAPLQRSQF